MSAGKGDKPRKVDGEKYRNNYDKIFRKQTWEEWAEELGDWIKSPDGFKHNPRDYKYSYKEYMNRRIK